MSTSRTFTVNGRGDHWISWSRKPDSQIECRSHALRLDDGGVWLVDPLDAPELAGELERLGTVAGVVQLLDRHERDCAALAERYGVEHWAPPGDYRNEPSAARRYGDGITGTPFRLLPVKTGRLWTEFALWWEERTTLVVADCIGSASYFPAVDEESVAVHPLLRAFPPRRLEDLHASVVLMGHGDPVVGDTDAVPQAISTSRARMPQYALKTPGRLWEWGKAMRK